MPIMDRDVRLDLGLEGFGLEGFGLGHVTLALAFCGLVCSMSLSTSKL